MQAKPSILCLSTYLLLIICTNARMTYFPILPITDATILKCLKTSGYLDEAFTHADYNDTHNWISTTTPASINTAGTTPHLVLNLAPIKWQSAIVQNEATIIAKQFQNTKLKMIWLDPLNNNIYRNNITCAIVSSLAKAITAKTNVQVGIFSNIRSWTSTFGNQKACPELSAFPLFVYDFQNKPVAFGGWTSWDFEYLQTNRGVCNNDFPQVRRR